MGLCKLNFLERKILEMKYVKLTNCQGKTQFNTNWGPGIRNWVWYSHVSPINTCSNGLHFYMGLTERDAMFFAYIFDNNHAEYFKLRNKPLIWRCVPAGDIKIDHSDAKGCSSELTTIQRINLPNITKRTLKVFIMLMKNEILHKNPTEIMDPKWKIIFNEFLKNPDYKPSKLTQHYIDYNYDDISYILHYKNICLLDLQSECINMIHKYCKGEIFTNNETISKIIGKALKYK